MNLYEKYKNYEKDEIPKYISENLVHELYYWQREALQNLLVHEKIREQKNIEDTALHLMFNMATGSGKTLLMAACMLYYYEKGYRNFLFFTNLNNIVDKTENNFLDPDHTKYLFKPVIKMEDSTISIKNVENFSKNPKNLEIKFTSIQKLYNDIHAQKENRMTLEELNLNDVVMLADEAHHLNANTKNLALKQNNFAKIDGRTGVNAVERRGWEHTVIELILNKATAPEKKNKNILLEFTATLPHSKDVRKKYSNKIIYKFGLEEFLAAGYTKGINFIPSTLNKKQRMLQAVLFSWYRKKIAQKSFKQGNLSLENFKPVILFRSRTIKDSWKDFFLFEELIENLEKPDIFAVFKMSKSIPLSDFIDEQGGRRTGQIQEFIQQNNISYDEILTDIKTDYAKNNCMITNSKTNKRNAEQTSVKQEKLLNSLEDKDNHIRAIFTVKRLTEGWDVLNLYDIVRLYKGVADREITLEEKQLIGRGIRYYPFSIPDVEDKCGKRKFDSDNPLKILEELNYYTYDENSEYLELFKKELTRDGYKINSHKVVDFNLKPEFQQSLIYENLMLFSNAKQKKFLQIDFEKISDEKFGVYDVAINYRENTGSEENFIINLKDIEQHIINKAVNIKAVTEDSIYRFENLRKISKLRSVAELFGEKGMLSNSKITINQSLKSCNADQRLKLAIDFLTDVENLVGEQLREYTATELKPMREVKEIFPLQKSCYLESENLSVDNSPEWADENWYVWDKFYGNPLEQEVLSQIALRAESFKRSYDEFYVLKNMGCYHIYNNSGERFYPDIILLLYKKESRKCYQILITSSVGNLIADLNLERQCDNHELITLNYQPKNLSSTQLSQNFISKLDKIANYDL